MEDHSFDRIVRALAAAGDRREVVKRIGATALAGIFGLQATDALGRAKTPKPKPGDDDDDKDDDDDDGGQGKKKVTICHKPGTPAEKTKRVPESALAGHLGHGDTKGPCPGDSGCKVDGDCDDKETCENGKCVPVGCKVDGDCDDCESCVNGTCKSDCTTGETCKNDTCVSTCPPACPDTCDVDGKCPQCPGGCPANSTCVDNDCMCNAGFVPGPNDTCIPEDDDDCPGQCFFIEDRDACFRCPKGSKATSRGTCRCQFKARECKRKFGGQAVKPTRCENS